MYTCALYGWDWCSNHESSNRNKGVDAGEESKLIQNGFCGWIHGDDIFIIFIFISGIILTDVYPSKFSCFMDRSESDFLLSEIVFIGFLVRLKGSLEICPCFFSNGSFVPLVQWFCKNSSCFDDAMHDTKNLCGRNGISRIFCNFLAIWDTAK